MEIKGKTIGTGKPLLCVPVMESNKEEIIKALPFVLISQKPAELLIPDSIRKDLNLRFIDCYDNNRWAKGHKRYDSVFISNVTIVEPIKEQ